MLARTLACMICAAAALAACTDDIGPPRVTPPAPPAGFDSRYAVTGVGLWNLIGNPLTPGQDQLTIDVTAPDDTAVIDAWIAGGAGQRLDKLAAGHFAATVSIAALAAGEYQVLLAADGATTAFASATFFRTHPLYFVVSTDWDFAEPGQVALDAHDLLRSEHPDIRFTQFVGPYTYTDPAVTAARQAEITTWLTSRRDQYGDEIALHIHPWCHFVATASIPCITDQSTVYPAGDDTGYTIKLSAYGQAGMEALLDAADAIFAAHGLGKPVTFRAGGWTASIDTLKALAAKGFVADTSALNWARIEEWNRPPSELYNWNMATWSTIGDTSQPYRPNVDDKQSPAAPQVPILEVPDNAAMVDYVTTQEMIGIFAANWPGPALTTPRVYMMGFHPSSSFSIEERNRVDGILSHADGYLASQHAGPVVYALLRDLPTAFPPAP